PAGASATLTADSLQRNAGATVDFNGNGLGTMSSRILFANAPATVGSNGGILPYASFSVPSGDNEFATYDATLGITPFTRYVTSLAAAGPDDTVKLTNPNEVVAADKTINALLIRNNNAPFGTNGVVVNPGVTLTLGSGGLVMLILGGVVTPTIAPG